MVIKPRIHTLANPKTAIVTFKFHCYLIELFAVFLGMFAIRAERDYCIEEDMMKAVRKVADNKKLESKLDYKPL